MNDEKRDFRKEINDAKDRASEMRSKYNSVINKYDDMNKNLNKTSFLIDSLTDCIKGPAADKIINDMKEINDSDKRKVKENFEQVKMKYENDIDEANNKIYSLEKEYRDSTNEKNNREDNN